jgi:transient receptor potential cation channel subfamily M protein 3
MPTEIQEQLIHTIMKTFNYTQQQANNLFKELMMCVKKRDLVKIIFKYLKTNIFSIF